MGIKWIEEKWNKKAGRALGNKEAVKALNAYLDLMQTKAYDARRKLIEAQKQVSTEGIKNLLTGNSEQLRLLLEIFQQHQ